MLTTFISGNCSPTPVPVASGGMPGRSLHIRVFRGDDDWQTACTGAGGSRIPGKEEPVHDTYIAHRDTRIRLAASRIGRATARQRRRRRSARQGELPDLVYPAGAGAVHA